MSRNFGNIDNVILSGNLDDVKDIITKIHDFIGKMNDNHELLLNFRELQSSYNKIHKNNYEKIIQDTDIVDHIKKYIKIHRFNESDMRDYVKKFIKWSIETLNKNVISSKRHETKLRRISRKNSVARLYQSIIDDLVNLFGMLKSSNFIKRSLNSINEDVKSVSVLSFKQFNKKVVPNPDILPVSGAGQDGTDTLVKRYKMDTPYQNLKESEECRLYTYNEIKDLEKFADRLLNKFGVDIGFTRHFADRMSDGRNHPCIKISELQDLFKRIESHKADKIRQNPNGEFVISDLQHDLNLPIVIDYKNGEFDVTVKTIMRKKNFATTNKKLTIETFVEVMAKD